MKLSDKLDQILVILACIAGLLIGIIISLCVILYKM